MKLLEQITDDSLYELLQSPLKNPEETFRSSYYFYSTAATESQQGLRIEATGYYDSEEQQLRGVTVAAKDVRRKTPWDKEETDSILSFVQSPTEASFVAFFGTMLGTPALRPLVELNYTKRMPGLYTLCSSTLTKESAELALTQKVYGQLHQSHWTASVGRSAHRLHIGKLPSNRNVLSTLNLESLQGFSRHYSISERRSEYRENATISYSKKNELQFQLSVIDVGALSSENVNDVEKFLRTYRKIEFNNASFRISNLPEPKFFER